MADVVQTKDAVGLAAGSAVDNWSNAMADETTSCVGAPTPDEDPLEVAVERRLSDGRLGDAGPFTIFRVPAHLREQERTLYEPRLVSVGPYYHGRAELRAMEQHKWRYLRHLLERAACVPQHAGKQPLRALVCAVRAVESRARGCYSEAIDDVPDFAEMLLLDGCFVLEFFFKWHKGEPDALRDAGWALVLLHSDLLLMENQVPFFVLEALFHAIFCGRTPRDLLVELLLLYIKPNGALLTQHQSPSSPCPAPAGTIDHLLHLFHEAFVPTPQAAEPPARSPPRVIPGVSALRDAGVRFVKKRTPRDMFDITFDTKRGVLEMPPMAIDQAQLPLLVNLIAFEQSRGRRTPGPGGAPLSSYAALMSSLVRTGKDVEELQAEGIVDNMLSSDDEAATKFFQPLGDCCSLNYDDHLFAPLFADVKSYHDNSWHRHRAKFMRDHCSNPWSICAFVLAVLAFFFSLFNQTVSVYNLAHPQPPPAHG
ncbi:unnamed protein product [Urochloa decumbens]|uniref:Uncharacterized protein n=1 Tax=Urochloa decumbens TaxID=240449 RepID=A0ABC9HG12_9POAL